MTVYVPGTSEKDPSKVIMSLQAIAAQQTTIAANITTLQTSYQAAKVTGTTTNDNATAGYIGEIIDSEILSGSAISITTGVSANITSVSLTAGDWDVWGNFSIQGASSTSSLGAGITTTSATFPTSPNKGGMIFMSGDQAGATWPCGQRRISIGSTTIVYLVVKATFAGTGTAFGYIGSRRVR